MALSQAKLFEDPVPMVRSCPLLNDIRLAEEIKELTIEVKDGGLLFVHRIILAARIPSLRAKLAGPLTQENSVLRWPTIPLSAASAFMNYVYTGQAEITQANVKGMVALARMMNLSNLENWGVKFMAGCVTLDNLATTWDFACSLHNESLMGSCIHLMRTQFKRFIRAEPFPCLPAETMLALLRDDNLQVDSEEEVFEAISSWVGPASEDLNERFKLHAITMLKEVRWLQTSVQFRNRLMASHPMFQKSAGCARFLGLVEQWMQFNGRNRPPCPFNHNRRLSLKLFVFVKEINPVRRSVLAFSSDLQKVERLADMEYRSSATYSVVGDSIFVIGGGFPGSTRVQEFLVRERCWRERMPLAVGRYKHAATVVRVAGGDKTLIGVFGGATPHRISSCEVYDVQQDRWCRLPDLREARSGPAAVFLPGDSRIFVLGGDGLSSSVEYCQLGADWQARASAARSADFWMQAAPLLTGRHGLAATAFRGRILVAGGYSGPYLSNGVEMFSPPDANNPRGQWTEVASMQRSRAYFTLLSSASGTVFAVGSNNTVETLTAPDFGTDPTSWVWSLQSPLTSLSEIDGAAIICL